MKCKLTNDSYVVLSFELIDSSAFMRLSPADRSVLIVISRHNGKVQSRLRIAQQADVSLQQLDMSLNNLKRLGFLG